MSNSTQKAIIKVTAIRTTTAEGTPLEDKNGKEYKVIEFSTPDFIMLEGMKVRVEPKKTSITRYAETYLDNKPHFGYDSKVGNAFLGDIVTREVPTYVILSKEGGEREVNSYSTVVFGDSTSSDFELKVKREFKNAGHEITLPRAAFAPSAVVAEEAAF